MTARGVTGLVGPTGPIDWSDRKTRDDARSWARSFASRTLNHAREYEKDPKRGELFGEVLNLHNAIMHLLNLSEAQEDR